MDDEKLQKAILLVEDEVIVALDEKRQLQNKGYRVVHVVSGEDAIKYALDQAAGIDLILMDIDLGRGIDGTRAAEVILQQKEIPVVFLSSHTEHEIVEKTEKITSYGFVVKNSGIIILDASIKMALKLFREKSENTRIQANLLSLIESTSDVIALYDRDIRLIAYNKACSEIYRRLFGVTLQLGQCTLDLFPASQRGWWQTQNDRALSGETFTVKFDIELSKDEIIFFESTFNPIRRNGEVVGFSTVTRDVGLNKN